MSLCKEASPPSRFSGRAAFWRNEIRKTTGSLGADKTHNASEKGNRMPRNKSQARLQQVNGGRCYVTVDQAAEA